MPAGYVQDPRRGLLGGIGGPIIICEWPLMSKALSSTGFIKRWTLLNQPTPRSPNLTLIGASICQVRMLPHADDSRKGNLPPLVFPNQALKSRSQRRAKQPCLIQLRGMADGCGGQRGQGVSKVLKQVLREQAHNVQRQARRVHHFRSFMI